MFHYEPTHTEHFQPHINVYTREKNWKTAGDEVFSYHYTEIPSVWNPCYAWKIFCI